MTDPLEDIGEDPHRVGVVGEEEPVLCLRCLEPFARREPLLRGEGQLERAWQAAIAGWARARLAGEAAGDLRADLDRLVRQGIIPDRTRDIPDADRLTVEFAMRAEWELVKQKWR